MKEKWIVAGAMTVGLSLLAGPAQAHVGGPDDGFVIGYYYGHTGDYQTPDPEGEPKLLVDPHPWQLEDTVWEMHAVDGLLNGFLADGPDFHALQPELQEFHGHEYYSWLDDPENLWHEDGNPEGYTEGDVDVQLHLSDRDPALRVYVGTSEVFASGDTLDLGWGAHAHLDYFVAAEDAQIGDTFTATFYLSDAAGSLNDSAPFEVSFAVVPEPGSLALLGAGAGLLMLRRRR